MIVDLFLTLEDTIVDVTYLWEHRMTHNALHTVTTILTVGGYCFWQFGNLVDVFADVSTDIPWEIVRQTMTIAYCEFPTIVLYLTGVDPLARAFSHGSNTFH